MPSRFTPKRATWLSIRTAKGHLIVVRPRYILRRLTSALLLSSLLFLGACQPAHPSVLPTMTADNIVNLALRAGLKDTTFHLTFAFDLGGERGHTTTTINGQGMLTTHPSRVRIQFSSSEQGNVGTGEVITDDTHTFVKDGSATQWTTHDVTQASFVNRGDFLHYETLRDTILVGVETIHGRDTWHLRARPPVSALAPLSVASPTTIGEDLWLVQTTYYPLAIVIQTSGRASVPNANGQQIITQQSLELTMSFTAWDTGVIIQLPTPDA